MRMDGILVAWYGMAEKEDLGSTARRPGRSSMIFQSLSLSLTLTQVSTAEYGQPNQHRSPKVCT